MDYLAAFGRRSTWADVMLALVISAVILLVGRLVLDQVYWFVFGVGAAGGYVQGVGRTARERELRSRSSR